MGKYFGTDGFRGEANADLTFEHAVKIGRFLGWYYGARQDKKAKVNFVKYLLHDCNIFFISFWSLCFAHPLIIKLI